MKLAVSSDGSINRLHGAMSYATFPEAINEHWNRSAPSAMRMDIKSAP
jgi:hypothetical protein